MKHRAFTLIEMLAAMVIVLILFSAMITVTGRLKNESRKRLTASAIAVIETALEQYYENTSPKQYPPQIAEKTNFETAIGQTVNVISPGTFDAVDDPNFVPPKLFWNAGAAYYFLARIPQSKAILESLSNQMISNRDSGGAAILIEIPAGAAATDWVRFVDVWGTSIRYAYLGSGTPVLTSAGPDKIFDTEDDVISP